MTNMTRSLLLLGESDVGKTHYGAQALRRLNAGHGAFELVDGANLEPFRTALDKISQGLSAPHTPLAEYSESIWSLRQKSSGADFDLVWPDYGGEQLSEIINVKSLPNSWRQRIISASGWIFMVRPSHVPVPDDILTRPVSLPAVDYVSNALLSPQSKQIEVLQMLQFKERCYSEHKGTLPPLAVLLSCYDELATKEPPGTYCRNALPMLSQYLSANWPKERLRIFAVSPLGQPLSQTEPNEVFASLGPEKNGFVINEEGEKSDDLLAPLEWLFSVLDSP